MFFCRILFLDVSKSGYTDEGSIMMHQQSIGNDLEVSGLIRPGKCLECGEKPNTPHLGANDTSQDQNFKHTTNALHSQLTATLSNPQSLLIWFICFV
jgi:hypothetical protein